MNSTIYWGERRREAEVSHRWSRVANRSRASGHHFCRLALYACVGLLLDCALTSDPPALTTPFVTFHVSVSVTFPSVTMFKCVLAVLCICAMTGVSMAKIEFPKNDPTHPIVTVASTSTCAASVW